MPRLRPPPNAWKKGQSGNPGGRPKETKEIVEEFRKHGTLALDKIIEIIKHGKTESGVLRACEMLLDRAYGKPVQTTVVTDQDDRQESQLSIIEIQDRLAKLASEKAADRDQRSDPSANGSSDLRKLN